VDEGILMLSMLLDFYGELLTEKQRECFDLYYNEDLSLAEIAEQSGISRQAVWTNIKHAEASLYEIENKTGLIERFGEYRSSLNKIRAILEKISSSGDEQCSSLAKEAIGIAESLRT